LSSAELPAKASGVMLTPNTPVVRKLKTTSAHRTLLVRNIFSSDPNLLVVGRNSP
jgi:hypothetical protein